MAGGRTGRPSIYNQNLAEEICDSLSSGKSLRKICLSDTMPGQTTIFRWLHENEEFRKQYTQARTHQADTLFDECLDIADDRLEEQTSPYAVARARLRIDTRKWMSGKLNPKKYGEKSEDNDSPDRSFTFGWRG